MRWASLLVACFWSMSCFAQSQCQQKEYAQYKDQTPNRPGRLSMASEYCLSAIRIEGWQKQADNAMQYQMMHDHQEAMRAIETCMAVQSKILDALTAAKATKAIEYMLDHCGGKYNGIEGKK
jgi:hypothetical protein